MRQLVEGFLREIESELVDIMELVDTVRYKIREAQIYDMGKGKIGVSF